MCVGLSLDGPFEETAREAEFSQTFLHTCLVTKAAATEALERVKGNLQINKILFVDTLRRLSALCAVAPKIEQMDIMPTVASTRSVVALDISVKLS